MQAAVSLYLPFSTLFWLISRGRKYSDNHFVLKKTFWTQWVLARGGVWVVDKGENIEYRQREHCLGYDRDSVGWRLKVIIHEFTHWLYDLNYRYQDFYCFSCWVILLSFTVRPGFWVCSVLIISVNNCKWNHIFGIWYNETINCL